MGDAIERESRFGVETGTLYEAELTEVWAHTDKPGRTCPWDRRDTAQYVLAVVLDDDPGRHAGEAWMLPSASLPAPALGEPTGASFDQQVIDAAHACGRKVAVTGRSMENIMKVSTELGYMKVPKGTLTELNR